MATQTKVLIAPKHFKEFEPSEYHDYVKSMYEERQNSSKPTSPAPGIAFTRTKKGKLSIRFTQKFRAFRYITEDEVRGVLAHYENLQMDRSELIETLKEKNFIIAKNRLEAEKQYTKET